MSGSNLKNINRIFYGLLIIMMIPSFLYLFMSRESAKVLAPPVLKKTKDGISIPYEMKSELHLVVLGVAQDAGYPQADCKKSCCKAVWQNKSKRKMVSCLGVRDPSTQKVYLFDATPDLKDQLQLLKYAASSEYSLAGMFLTHAHMGHYTGLLHLGRESVNADKVPTYTMPRMSQFLSNNGPWDNLVKFNNIELNPLTPNEPIQLSEQLAVTALEVPHRDEYSETVGFVIQGPNKKVLFIPDIDKWTKWSVNINELIAEVDYAFLDGTFYRNGEIWGRDMSEIPHPFISESMERFKDLPASEKKKIHFIHLNHTNPLLDINSEEYQDFSKSDFRLAREGQVIIL